MVCVGVLVLCVSCGRRYAFPVHSQHETLLSIGVEFELLSATNPYLDAAPRDLTGRHLARGTLIRLANYADLYPGRFAPEVLVLGARAQEWLGDYGAAWEMWREAAV